MKDATIRFAASNRYIKENGLIFSSVSVPVPRDCDFAIAITATITGTFRNCSHRRNRNNRNISLSPCDLFYSFKLLFHGEIFSTLFKL
ncbi:hypothetical protein P8452_49903 [Trifolium repens]|nr:hypothetical protein P8452_49903 [Trifolium repens]